MEAVQSVQLPDNSIPLIGSKRTFVRVYLQSDAPIDVTGYLFGETPEGRSYHIFPVTPTADKSVTVKPGGSDRGKMDNNLIFELDGDVTVRGRRNISVLVYSVLEGPGRIPPLPTEHYQTMTVEFTRRIDLHVYGLVWKCSDNSDVLPWDNRGPAAPWTDFEAHRRFGENVFPVSTFTIDPIPGIGDQAPDPQPFKSLTEMRSWAAKKVKDLPRGSLINALNNWYNGGMQGKQEGSVTDEENTRDSDKVGAVMSQEIAHFFSLDWHTFSSGTPYPRESGGLNPQDIGMDVTGTSPQVVGRGHYDIMSYNIPPPSNWISSFTYLELLKGITSRGPFETWRGNKLDDISAVSWGANRVDVFTCSQPEAGIGRAIYHKYWDWDHWGSGWENLGGNPDGYVSAVSWGHNRIDVFIRSYPDGAILHKYWNGSGWYPIGKWENLGGISEGQISAVSWGPNRLDIFVRARSTRAVHHRCWDWDHWHPTDGWESLGGDSDGYVSAVSWGHNRIDVFIRSYPDGAILHKYWNGSGWYPIGKWENLGGISEGQISAVSWGPNRLDIFVIGTDGALYHRYWDGSGWNPIGNWENLHGEIEKHSISTTSWGPNRLDIFVRGTDGALYHKYWNGSHWGTSLEGYQTLGGQSDGKISAVSWGPNHLDLFAISKSTSLLIHKRFNDSMWGNTLET
jgi:hypothetical protein